MAGVYRTGAVAGLKPEAFVVHCSDPRYQAHFHDFLRQHLKLNAYGLVVVPGGAQLLRMAEVLPKFSWAGWRWVKFLMNLAEAPKVILIGHDDCRWYSEGPLRLWRGDPRERVIGDLRKVRQEIAERFPGVEVELYFARLDGQQAVFEAI